MAEFNKIFSRDVIGRAALTWAVMDILNIYGFEMNGRAICNYKAF